MSEGTSPAVTDQDLLENAIAAALSAIEVYNKPDFKYRESTFTILMVNAWELLLKAKLLHDAGGDFDSLLVVDAKSGEPKTTRSGNPMTHEITYCLRHLKLPQALLENVERLIEIRDTVIHLCPSQPIKYLVYTLAAASLRNFEKACRDWFGRSLAEYNFYILPLSFAFNFTTFSALDLSRHPDTLKRLLGSIAESQESSNQESGYIFVCEIQAQVVSAKKLTEPADLTVAIDPDSSNTAILKPQMVLDRYPISTEDLWIYAKKNVPSVRQNKFYEAIKKLGLKEDRRYSHPNFRLPKHRKRFIDTGYVEHGTPFLYNQDALRALVDELNRKYAEGSQGP
jgi:hypothetical protein